MDTFPKLANDFKGMCYNVPYVSVVGISMYVMFYNILDCWK